MGTLLPARSYAFDIDDAHEVNSFSSGLVTLIQKLGVCLLHLILSQIQPCKSEPPPFKGHRIVPTLNLIVSWS